MKVTIIGIDDSSTPSFSKDVVAIIAQGKLFSGGARHREIVGALLPDGYEWIDIVPPMTTLFERYTGYDDVVVFASGDPLFYGFAQSVQRLLPDAEIAVFPHFNSLQQLAHAALMPYQDMHNVSLTGRDWHKFDAALIEQRDMIGVLTDRVLHTPTTIASRMVEYGYTNYDITVGELLGNVDQKVTTMSLEQAAQSDFAYPNNLILKRSSKRARSFGIPESDFELLNGRAKMITKMPIRLASLSQLNLSDAQTMWDIGFCTGSVSVEAKLQFPHLRVVSFEVREECAAIIESNMRRFGTPGIEYHIGDFTATDLTNIANPNAIFIGGHGGKMRQIVDIAAPLLNPQGTIVFNSVSQESYNDFTAAIEANGLKIENEITMQVDAFNPITILKAVKQK
ncbi:MAG: precorrin-6y C5,15-methyltransferase (decarboxylating) subunit CbiE [Rikenellaceae bacterium]